MKRLLIILLALLSALVLTGCATRRQLQVVDRITHDTLYQSNVHYDSIYVSQDKYIDRSRDTVYLRDVSVECISPLQRPHYFTSSYTYLFSKKVILLSFLG